MTCWFCYWGWPKAVRDVYDAAVAKLGGDEHWLRYGPSHVVWEDENFDDESIRHCIDRCENPGDLYGDIPGKTLLVIRESLDRLLALPAGLRSPPDDYDDENPALYPPPAGVEMIRG